MADTVQTVLIHYSTRAPRASELTGFKPGTILLNTHVLSGSDQGINSKWVVKKMDNNEVVFTPLDSKHLNSTRSRPLTGFFPYAVQGLHSTKSYFTPLPVHTNANL